MGNLEAIRRSDAGKDGGSPEPVYADLEGNLRIAGQVTDTLASITAARLAMGKQGRVTITCTLADTDYPCGSTIPEGAKYVYVLCSNNCRIAVDEATANGVGLDIPAMTPMTIPITFGAGDSKIHAQSPVAGSVVQLCYLWD